MNSIIYIDDYINIYNSKNNKIYRITPYKNSVNKGLIINKEKVIRKLNKVLKEEKLNNSILFNNIIVITNNSYSKDYKIYIKELLNELNYKVTSFKSEIDYININNNKLIINYNYKYYYIYYINKDNKVEMNIYENNYYNKEVLSKIIKLLDKKEIYLYGKNIDSIIPILDRLNSNYYVYENSEFLLINMFVKNICQIKKK